MMATLEIVPKFLNGKIGLLSSKDAFDFKHIIMYMEKT